MSRRFTIVILAAAALGYSSSANAQLPEATLEVKSERISTDGRLFACYLQFEALIRDQIYRQGEYTLVGGSLGYTVNGTMLLKVALRDLDEALKPLPTDRPASAYVETPERANNVDGLLGAQDDEASAGRLFVFNIDEVTLRTLDQMLSGERVTVAFNRKKGGTDLRLPVDLTVASIDNDLKPVRSETHLDDFRGCMAQLLPLIEMSLERAK